MLRALWEYDGAPKLDGIVPKLGSVRPRTVTASRPQVDALLDGASRTLRLFLLLCSDLAIRSGTAVKLTPANYHADTGEIRFTTKYNEQVCLPTTAEIAEILDSCDLNSPIPFITQLRKQEEPRAARRMVSNIVSPSRLRKELKALRLELKIEKRIIPHDLRRTTAVALYRRTKDLRTTQALLGHRNLQSTFWYLDHDLEPVNIADLEAIKRPFLVKPTERTA